MDWTPVLRLLLAAGLAIPLGLEREFTGKAAGLRTHILVAVACAALGWASIETADDHEFADATRIASGVVTGVGFIGAGTILAVRGRVHGLTTAAAVFAVAAMGLCAGLGFTSTAIAVTVVALASLWLLDWVREHTYVSLIRSEHTISAVLADASVLGEVQRVLEGGPAELRFLQLDELGAHVGAHITVRGTQAETRQALEAIAGVAGVLGAPALYASSVEIS